jgi:hypothetical protein
MAAALKKLGEPARLPCCDFPEGWSPKKGGQPMVDVRKCLWVADKLLMKRHTRTAYAFAASLAIKASFCRLPTAALGAVLDKHR